MPLRLVVDTSTVVSTALKPTGLQRTVLLLALSRPSRLYLFRLIFKEYKTVPARPGFQIREALRQQFLQLIENRARFVAPARQLQVAADPGDNIFVECADAARADHLVTGNVRHFPRFWKRTKIIRSREFSGLSEIGDRSPSHF